MEIQCPGCTGPVAQDRRECYIEVGEWDDEGSRGSYEEEGPVTGYQCETVGCKVANFYVG
jgi:hypothetical protein